MTDQIPLIVPSFNQLSFLRQLVNWWRLHRPHDPVFVVDNASDYEPLVGWLEAPHEMVEVCRYPENECKKNVYAFLQERVRPNFKFYVISDPDILPHPATPPEFLGVFQKLVEEMGLHHAGFGLITNDLPDYIEPGSREEILLNEAFVQTRPELQVEYGGKVYTGRKAEIDSTFALYKSEGSGWQSPMPGEDWQNSARFFQAHHLGWYVHPTIVPPELDHYYNTVRTPLHGDRGSAGINHYRPSRYNERAERLWKEHYDSLPPEQRDA